MSALFARLVGLGALVSVFGLACAAPQDETAREQPELDGEGPRDVPKVEKSAGSSQTPSAPSSPVPPGSASPAAPPTPTEEPNSRTCATARQLGAPLAGDAPSEMDPVSGACSDWLQVRLEETSLLSKEMRIAARLRSPPGDNYDLFVYLVQDGAALECGVPVAVGQSGTNVDEVAASWGDWGLVGTGIDDSRTVVFEVRKKTGGCSVSPWTLEVRTGTK